MFKNMGAHLQQLVMRDMLREDLSAIVGEIIPGDVPPGSSRIRLGYQPLSKEARRACREMARDLRSGGHHVRVRRIWRHLPRSVSARMRRGVRFAMVEGHSRTPIAELPQMHRQSITEDLSPARLREPGFRSGGEVLRLFSRSEITIDLNGDQLTTGG